MGKKIWLGFDLGGTKMMATVYDHKFEKVLSVREKIKRSSENFGQENISGFISRLLSEAKLDSSDLAGIGVACAGTIELDKGIILEAPNLGWKNVPLRKHLSGIFKCPVTLANDVDAGTYGEYRMGAGKDSRCVLGVFPGTGIGGACVYNGKLMRGKTGSCLEVGHVQVSPDGPICGCGRIGCIEAIASRLAISAQVAMAAFRGQAPYIMEKAGTDLGKIRSKVLAKAIENGDNQVEKILRHSARLLGKAIASMVNVLAPDSVVLGGGLVEALPDLFQKEVSETVSVEAMDAFSGKTEITIAKLGDDATALGAALLIEDQVSNG